MLAVAMKNKRKPNLGIVLNHGIEMKPANKAYDARISNTEFKIPTFLAMNRKPCSFPAQTKLRCQDFLSHCLSYSCLMVS